jgi:hypothetical protein
MSNATLQNQQEISVKVNMGYALRGREVFVIDRDEERGTKGKSTGSGVVDLFPLPFEQGSR